MNLWSRWLQAEGRASAKAPRQHIRGTANRPVPLERMTKKE